MPSRSKLKNLLAGIFGSFVSRNNDVDGYWGIGQLCLLSKLTSNPQIHIDLLESSMQPMDEKFKSLLAAYSCFIQDKCSVMKLEPNRLKLIQVTIDFSPSSPPKFIPMVTRGELFQLTVQVGADLSKVYRLTGYGYCEPHSPKKEYQRFQS
jgi:hypothetical protein